MVENQFGQSTMARPILDWRLEFKAAINCLGLALQKALDPIRLESRKAFFVPRSNQRLAPTVEPCKVVGQLCDRCCLDLMTLVLVPNKPLGALTFPIATSIQDQKTTTIIHSSIPSLAIWLFHGLLSQSCRQTILARLSFSWCTAHDLCNPSTEPTSASARQLMHRQTILLSANL